MIKINPYLKGERVPSLVYRPNSGIVRALTPHKGTPLHIIVHEGKGDFDKCALPSILKLVNDARLPTREIFMPGSDDSLVRSRVVPTADYQPIKVPFPEDEKGKKLVADVENDNYANKIFQLGEIDQGIGNFILTGGVFDYCLFSAFRTLLRTVQIFPYDVHFPLTAIYDNCYACDDNSWNPNLSNLDRLWAPRKIPDCIFGGYEGFWNYSTKEHPIKKEVLISALRKEGYINDDNELQPKFDGKRENLKFNFPLTPDQADQLFKIFQAFNRSWEVGFPYFAASVENGMATRLAGKGDPTEGCLRFFYWRDIQAMLDFIRLGQD